MKNTFFIFTSSVLISIFCFTQCFENNTIDKKTKTFSINTLDYSTKITSHTNIKNNKSDKMLILYNLKNKQLILYNNDNHNDNHNVNLFLKEWILIH